MNEDTFAKAASMKDIPLSQMKEVLVDGHKICIANVEGKYFAIDNTCSHEGGPLADGNLEGYQVECPWHQSRFDMRTGEVKAPPASEPQETYQIKLEGDDIMIRLNSGKQGVRSVSKGTESAEYKLLLQERQALEGTDIMTFKFSKQEKDGQTRILEYTAGQFAFFDIGNVQDDPKGPVRHFTIASSPTEDFILISTRIRDSPYKKRLDSLRDGTIVKVRGPEGKFTLHEDYSKPAVFLSGGIGVTPFRSMIKYATDKNLSVRIIMFDSNRNQQNILYKKEFDDCATVNKNLKIIYTITDQTPGEEWKGESGRIDAEMLKKHLQPDELENSIFYICGPPAMLEGIQKLLKESLQIPSVRVKIEEFTGY